VFVGSVGAVPNGGGGGGAGGGAYTLLVPENSVVGPLHVFAASDVDVGDNGRVQYSIQSKLMYSFPLWKVGT